MKDFKVYKDNKLVRIVYARDVVDAMFQAITIYGSKGLRVEPLEVTWEQS